MKRKMLGIWAGLLLFAAPVHAREEAPVVRVFVDGEQVIFEHPPILEQGTTLVPFRAISEKLGFEVAYRVENGDQSVTAAKGGETVTMYIGNRIANSAEGRVLLEQAPRIEHDLAYVPLRFLAEAMHVEVEWDGEQTAVRLHTQAPADGGAPPEEKAADPEPEAAGA
ncbi:copper amine oxidase N-terminal domain-containing protein [Paenibacillus caseinilyticus]|uniref:Copper amine oxidase n=1 Tax=Paenibacillus mucilaginosus K02 TaxID=997761 RepID=I0BC62_9BACL|nr:copper amine oxidase N-terminal domain-containing protein [Paenibacillus mucilaginosus]AFH59959.1 copper amine oxidase [Paenibacillus mucilaginosus K02]